MARKATIERKTKETDIKISLNLDGTGIYNIRTAVPFMDHMFSHIARHGFFDLTVKAKGDTEICHECLPEVSRRSSGIYPGSNRFAHFVCADHQGRER